MKKIEPYPVASALFFIFEIFYIICMLGKFVLLQLGIDGYWHMHKLWGFIIPGINNMNLINFVVGLVMVGLVSYISGYILVIAYNFQLNKNDLNKKSLPKPFFIRFKTLFFTLSTYMILLFSICMLYDLVVPQYLSMAYLWYILLPGFRELSWDSYLIGVFDIIVYSLYSASIFAGVINYFEKVQFVNVK